MLFSRARTHSFFALDCIPYEVDLWHFSLLKCPLWYESLNVKVPFHFLFVFSQHLLIASLILKPAHLLTYFEVQICRNLKMTRCQTNTQGLACVTWQFSRARKQVKVGKGMRFLFFSWLSCSAMRLTKPPCFAGQQGLLSMPGFSTTYGEKKYQEVYIILCPLHSSYPGLGGEH